MNEQSVSPESANEIEINGFQSLEGVPDEIKVNGVVYVRRDMTAADKVIAICRQVANAELRDDLLNDAFSAAVQAEFSYANQPIRL